ncbi:hypothetical protein XELAEV_18021824mg [Xenopus laevis]|uniref:Uncharacterized protein n=1 Tax=Xenopus laevis TaxID=8355 RepID=A0A974D3J3_XENLA|nr:hypothetical protein XELAEV_18021824mg [Xenopus laevis]
MTQHCIPFHQLGPTLTAKHHGGKPSYAWSRGDSALHSPMNTSCFFLLPPGFTLAFPSRSGLCCHSCDL